ncbi:hypothetical protein M595_3379 [Lyngbya aestuarii BL J]|uniref:Uncharacterized protein n=1 Tax=Lyngbya aestuarii BL J TaxID=1348334 RepID=U7QHT4_9CYAN|nr:hypothetical protein [Lyngbya aestuarii]ERT06645.1 hypothetical protein M595_3379 [Lyngbya aestuarii BL J]
MFKFIPRLNSRLHKLFFARQPKLSRLNSRLVALNIGIVSSVLTAIPALGAEQITISYGPAESSVSIDKFNSLQNKVKLLPSCRCMEHC